MDNPAQIQVSMSAICEGGSGATRPDIPEITSDCEYITADRPTTSAAFVLVWKQTSNSTNNPVPSLPHNTHSSNQIQPNSFSVGSLPRTMPGGAHDVPEILYSAADGDTLPIVYPRRLRCLVLGTSPFNPSNEAFYSK